MLRGIGSAMVGSLLIIVLLALLTGLCIGGSEWLNPSLGRRRDAETAIYLLEAILRIQREERLYDLVLELAPIVRVTLCLSLLSVSAGATYRLISHSRTARSTRERTEGIEEWRSIAIRLARANEQLLRLNAAEKSTPTDGHE